MLQQRRRLSVLLLRAGVEPGYRFIGLAKPIIPINGVTEQMLTEYKPLPGISETRLLRADHRRWIRGREVFC